jgi:hypothetical protein
MLWRKIFGLCQKSSKGFSFLAQVFVVSNDGFGNDVEESGDDHISRIFTTFVWNTEEKQKNLEISPESRCKPNAICKYNFTKPT